MSAIEIPYGHTRESLLQCLDREIRFREFVYPKQIEAGKMREKKALDEIAAMKAVRAVIAQLPGPIASQMPLVSRERER